MRFDPLSNRVLGFALDVHRAYGPGLLERTYEELLAIELSLAEVPFRRQVGLDLLHRGVAVPNAYRLDMVVGEALVMKIKAVEAILPVHRAQLLTYMRLSGISEGPAMPNRRHNLH